MSVPCFSGPKKVISPIEKSEPDASLKLHETISQTLPAQPSQVPKQTTKKKEKKIKDPTAPKRPLSAFFVFSKEQRPVLLAELGKLTVGEQGKELGKRWASLNQQQKQPYEDIIKDDWIRYLEEIKVYQPSTEFLEKKEGLTYEASFSIKSNNESYFNHLMNSWKTLDLARPDLSGKEIQDLVWNSWVSNISDSVSTCKVKTVKDPGEPKKPKSGFQLFVIIHRREVKEDHPEMDTKEINRSLKDNWENLDEDARRPYLEQADDLQAKYQEKIIEYRKSLEIVKTC